MHYINENELAQALIDFFLSFPIPTLYKDILKEQIAGSSYYIEQYCDCIKILFQKNPNSKTLPLWLPTMLQGCQILKENGPISCQLYVENGYVVQFEVVDMGLNEIDWNYFWSHKPIFDIEYNFEQDERQEDRGQRCVLTEPTDTDLET